MIKCIKCGAAIVDTAKTCPYCGALTSYGYHSQEMSKLEATFGLAISITVIGGILELVYFPYINVRNGMATVPCFLREK